MAPGVTVLDYQMRVLTSKRLVSREKHVALALSLRADWSALTCYPSVACIARDTGLSPSTVRRALHGLKTKHWVHVEYRGRKGRNLSNLYTLRLPGDDEQWEDDEEDGWTPFV